MRGSLTVDSITAFGIGGQVLLHRTQLTAPDRLTLTGGDGMTGGRASVVGSNGAAVAAGELLLRNADLRPSNSAGTIGGPVWVGDAAGATGSVLLNQGSTLSALDVTVGGAGSGMFSVSGSTASVGSLKVGSPTGGSSSVDVSAGAA